MEAEYAALSLAMRALIPIQQLIRQVIDNAGTSMPLHAQLQCTVFEDNQGCIALAANHQPTARTKHFLTKWHFFWYWVKAGFICIKHIATTEQPADIFTKGLAIVLFEYLRKQIMGW